MATTAPAASTEALRHAASTDSVEVPDKPEEEMKPKGTTHLKSAKTKDSDYQNVQWLWLHEDGWKEFNDAESSRIEDFLWKGVWMMRLRAGKGRRTRPREIYYWDGVQYNPKSGSVRQVRRVPALNCFQRLWRLLKAWAVAIYAGEVRWWKPLTMEEMIQRREGSYQALHEMYDRRKCAGRLIETNSFIAFSHFAILFNAIWIGVDAEYNTEESILKQDWGYIVMDNVFCTWFFVEVVIRFFAFRKRRYCWQDKWFLFDVFLVALNVAETWIIAPIEWLLTDQDGVKIGAIQVFRSARLFRVVRLTRLFKVVPQLMVQLKGITEAMKSLMWTIMLLAVLTYMFAVIFKTHADQQVYKNLGNKTHPDMRYVDNEFKTTYNINSVSDAYWCLIVYGVFMDAVSEIVLLLRGEASGWAVVFLVFVFLSNLTMLNMLIGILCEVIARVTNDEASFCAKGDLEQSVRDLLECYDMNEDGLLRRSEFHQLMNNPDLQMILEKNDIDHADLAKLEDVLFGDYEDSANEGLGEDDPKDDPSIKWDSFLERVFRLQGGNAAKVTDVVELRGYVRKSLKRAAAGKMGPKGLNKGGGSQVFPTTPFGSSMGANALAVDIDKANKEAQPSAAALPTGLSKFEEAVLEKLSAIQQDQSQLRQEVQGLRRRMDALSGTTIPGSVDCTSP